MQLIAKVANGLQTPDDLRLEQKKQFDKAERVATNSFVLQGSNMKVTENNCIVLSHVAIAVNQHITFCILQAGLN